MQLIPGFGSPKVPSAPPPPPPPTRQAPEVTAAKETSRLAALRRKGRRASILTGAEGLEDTLGAGTSIARPQARSATLLGGT